MLGRRVCPAVSGLQVVESRLDAVDGVWDPGGVFLDEDVGVPTADVGGQRGGAVEDGLLGVSEVLAPVVEVDDVDGLVVCLPR